MSQLRSFFATLFPPRSERRASRRACLLQSALAAGYILIVFAMLSSFDSGLMLPSLGASVFIVFAFPHTDSSRVRFLVGGYVVAGVWGVLFSLLRQVILAQALFPNPAAVCCALAVFAAMFCMSMLNFEHPPAAAMTVVLVLMDAPLPAALAAVGSVALLCLVRRLLARWLVNL